MSEHPPSDERKSLVRFALIAGGVVFLLILMGVGGFFLVNPPLSPANQTQTVDAILAGAVSTMTAQAQMKTYVAESINKTMTALAPTATSTPLPTPTSAFPAGTLKQSPGDGVQLVFIPAGEFTMGSNSASGKLGPENPAHTVYTDAYWIYQTQVTNAMFAKCFDAGVCLKHVGALDTHFTNPAYANHPVVYVTWDEALAYCKWQGGRLPTEAEWERAARGTSDRFYPWGEITAGADVTNANNTVGDTTAVGSYPKYTSFYGLLDMGGNVREWVMDWYSETYYQESPKNNPTGPETGTKKVLRGAGFYDPYPYAQTVRRFAHVPDSPGINRGFRCVIPTVQESNP